MSRLISSAIPKEISGVFSVPRWTSMESCGQGWREMGSIRMRQSIKGIGKVAFGESVGAVLVSGNSALWGDASWGRCRR